MRANLGPCITRTLFVWVAKTTHFMRASLRRYKVGQPSWPASYLCITHLGMSIGSRAWHSGTKIQTMIVYQKWFYFPFLGCYHKSMEHAHIKIMPHFAIELQTSMSFIFMFQAFEKWCPAFHAFGKWPHVVGEKLALVASIQLPVTCLTDVWHQLVNYSAYKLISTYFDQVDLIWPH